MEIREEQIDPGLNWAETEEHDTTDDGVREVHVKFHREIVDERDWLQRVGGEGYE